MKCNLAQLLGIKFPPDDVPYQPTDKFVDWMGRRVEPTPFPPDAAYWRITSTTTDEDVKIDTKVFSVLESEEDKCGWMDEIAFEVD